MLNTIFKEAVAILCILGAVIMASAQTALKTYVSTTPPNVASFEKYGSIPIDYSTGQISLSIPLYTLEVDKHLSIPLELKYANSGMKPDEAPSWTGHGWDLMVGYIQQEIRGTNDLGVKGLRDVSVKQEMQAYMTGTMPQTARYQYIQDVLKGIKDSQQDVFRLNFLGRSTEFYFDGQDVKFIRHMPYKVEVITGGIIVTDDKGYKFTFGETTVGSGSATVSETYPALGGTTVWYLTGITTPNNRSISLEYAADAVYIINNKSIFYSYGAYGMTDNGLHCVSRNKVKVLGESSSSIAQNVLRSINFEGKKITFNVVRRNDLQVMSGAQANALSSIVISNELNETVRQIRFTYDNNVRLRLDKLSIMDAAASPEAQVYNFEYYKYQGKDLATIPLMTSANRVYGYDHWGFYNAAANREYCLPRAKYEKLIPNSADFVFSETGNRSSDGGASKIGMLYKITYPSGGYSLFEYEPNQLVYSSVGAIPSFLDADYSEPPGTLVTEKRATCSPADSWGNVTGTFTIASQINANIYWEFYTSEQIGTSGLEIKRTDNGSVVVSKGGYTTSGNQAFVLSPGTYQYRLDASCDGEENSPNYAYFSITQRAAPQPVTVTVGGNRIWKIKDFDPVGGQTTVRRLEYAEAELTNSPNYISQIDLITEAIDGGPARLDCGPQYRINSDNMIPFAGYHIYYHQVSEYMGENGEGGRNVFRYGPTSGLSGNYLEAPYPPPTNFSWRSLALLKEEHQEKTGTTYRTRNARIYEYTRPPVFNTPEITNGVKFGFRAIMMSGLEIPANYNRYFNSGQVYLAADKFGYSRVVEKDYHNSADSVTRDRTITYSATDFLESGVLELKSDGTKVMTYTSYPNDYPSGTAFINDMKTKNLVSYPIEQVQWVESGSTKTITSGMLTYYRTGGTGLTDHIDRLNAGVPVPSGSFKFSNRGTGILPPAGTPTAFLADGKYELSVKYNRYDNWGNPLEIQPASGPPVSYIWSYKNKLPVAEIQNGAYSAVELALGGSSAVSTFSASMPSDATLRSFLAPLRSNTGLNGALIKTYTYKPSVGMTGSTDPSGRTTYYEYDGFGRLNATKDTQQKTKEVFNYHYRNQ